MDGDHRDLRADLPAAAQATRAIGDGRGAGAGDDDGFAARVVAVVGASSALAQFLAVHPDAVDALGDEEFSRSAASATA